MGCNKQLFRGGGGGVEIISGEKSEEIRTYGEITIGLDPQLLRQTVVKKTGVIRTKKKKERRGGPRKREKPRNNDMGVASRNSSSSGWAS